MRKKKFHGHFLGLFFLFCMIVVTTESFAWMSDDHEEITLRAFDYLETKYPDIDWASQWNFETIAQASNDFDYLGDVILEFDDNLEMEPVDLADLINAVIGDISAIEATRLHHFQQSSSTFYDFTDDVPDAVDECDEELDDIIDAMISAGILVEDYECGPIGYYAPFDYSMDDSAEVEMCENEADGDVLYYAMCLVVMGVGDIYIDAENSDITDRGLDNSTYASSVGEIVFEPASTNAVYWMEEFQNTDNQTYVGYSIHLIEDVCVPHHAKAIMLENHQEYELAAEEDDLYSSEMDYWIDEEFDNNILIKPFFEENNILTNPSLLSNYLIDLAENAYGYSTDPEELTVDHEGKGTIPLRYRTRAMAVAATAGFIAELTDSDGDSIPDYKEETVVEETAEEVDCDIYTCLTINSDEPYSSTGDLTLGEIVEQSGYTYTEGSSYAITVASGTSVVLSASCRGGYDVILTPYFHVERGAELWAIPQEGPCSQ